MPPSASAAPARRSRYAKWRALALALVYVLFAIHFATWKAFGKTLAPLELHEVMYTFELGIVTAGFLFMAAAVVATAIFGRFLCGWGCHIMSLQEAAAWLLRKIRVRPKYVRSRVLRFAPLVVALYMFGWPQVVRIAEGRPFPALRFSSDTEGVASFVTTDFWRNLPGPAIVVLTFLVCGFAVVYALGNRGFCVYGCPYGVAFRLADRIAPGRIRARPDACQQCGTCTSVCTSGVRVHDEIRNYGMVVNPKCMRDLDCVGSCPHEALRFGFGRPAFAKGRAKDAVPRLPYDFALWEEALMGVVFVATIVVFRGLYDRIPFLLTIGLGGIVAYGAVLGIRLVARPNVRLNNFQLKRDGRILAPGWAYAALLLAFLALSAHSASWQVHKFLGARAYARATRAPADDSAVWYRESARHLAFCENWGLLPAHSVSTGLGRIKERLGRPREAETHFREAIRGAGELRPALRAALYRELGGLLLRRGDRAPAVPVFAEAVRLDPKHAVDQTNLGILLAQQGRLAEAAGRFRAALALVPDSPELFFNLALALDAQGDSAGAVDNLEDAIRSKEDFAEAHCVLGSILLRLGRDGEAEPHLRHALEVTPDDADARFGLGLVLARGDRLEEALPHLEEAIRRRPEEAGLLLERATRLAPDAARLLQASGRSSGR